MDAASKTQEKLQGTTADLRALTKKQAVELLHQLSAGSISREANMAMKRWERVREIGAFTKMAKMMNMGQDLHKFARNTKSNYIENVDEVSKRFKEDW